MDNEEKGRLSTDEIMIMCKKLAYKYHQVSMRDDLISEGILAIYERLDKEPDVHPAELYNVARLAMSDYVNLKTRPTSVPINPTTRAVATKFSVPTNSSYSQAGINAITNASQPSVEFNDEYIAPAESGAKGYEDKEFIEKGLNLLTERDKSIIIMRYYDNMTLEDVGVKLGISLQAVAVRETKALKKMGKA